MVENQPNVGSKGREHVKKLHPEVCPFLPFYISFSPVMLATKVWTRVEEEFLIFSLVSSVSIRVAMLRLGWRQISYTCLSDIGWTVSLIEIEPELAKESNESSN